jgi:hypothetical protein
MTEDEKELGRLLQKYFELKDAIIGIPHMKSIEKNTKALGLAKWVKTNYGDGVMSKVASDRGKATRRDTFFCVFTWVCEQYRSGCLSKPDKVTIAPDLTGEVADGDVEEGLDSESWSGASLQEDPWVDSNSPMCSVSKDGLEHFWHTGPWPMQ